MNKELLQQALDAQVAKLMKSADSYAHTYAFVGDDTMPKMRAALKADIHAAIAQPVQPVVSDEAAEAIYEAAYEWSLYVEADNAPRALTVHMNNAIVAINAKRKA